VTTETGPNDARRVFWALDEVFFFFSVFSSSNQIIIGDFTYNTHHSQSLHPVQYSGLKRCIVWALGDFIFLISLRFFVTNQFYLDFSTFYPVPAPGT
jgi:hypothetical protein